MADTRQAFSLEGKIALVTGGGSGIGAATCSELTSAGATMLAEQVASSLPGAKAIAMDVTDRLAIQKVAAEQQRLDILINNAGIGHVGGILDVQPEDFDRLMQVNVHSVYYVTQAFLPLLLASHGCIVNIGSVAGMVGIKSRFAYCATKGAVLAMTRQLAVEYPRELRVNAIAPGTVQTPFVEGYLEKYHSHEKDKVREQLVARQPVGRLGTPEDVAGMVRYLCSEEASFINGAVLPLDGGWTAA